MPLKASKRGGFWHVVGTVRTAGRSIRVRKSTGLPAVREFLAEAEAEALQLETAIRAEVRDGVRPSCYVALACDRYLNRPRRRPLGKTSIDIVKAIATKFGLRLLSEISEREWS